MRDESAFRNVYGKWQKVAIALVVSFIILIVYFFVYPLIAVMIYGNFLDVIPDWLDATLEWSLTPLDWIYENVEWYERYIDYWFDV